MCRLSLNIYFCKWCLISLYTFHRFNFNFLIVWCLVGFHVWIFSWHWHCCTITRLLIILIRVIKEQFGVMLRLACTTRHYLIIQFGVICPQLVHRDKLWIENNLIKYPEQFLVPFFPKYFQILLESGQSLTMISF